MILRHLALAATLSIVAPAALAQQTSPTPEAPVTTAPTPLPDTGTPAPQATPEVRRAAETLHRLVGELQAGVPDYAAMTPELAEAVRVQSPTITPLLKGLGEVRDIEHRGQVQGAEHFRVLFAEGSTSWFIALDADGIVQTLVFRAE